MNDYRNPVVAEAMKVMKYVNMFNQGVKRVQDMLKDNGNKEAEFDISKLTVFCVNVFSNEEDTTTEKPQNDPGKVNHGLGSSQETAKISQKGSEKSSEKSSEKILRYIAKNPKITISELASEIGISERAISKNLDKLRDKSIRRVGPDKGGHWEIIESKK